MSEFNELINSSQPVLVDFTAAWCGPCKMMAPVLKELASMIGDKARILKVDIDRNPKAAEAYAIRSVPTLLLFREGKVIWRQSGVMSSRELLEVINKHS